MEVSRRDFLRLSVAAGTGTALSGLVGSGVNLGPTDCPCTGIADQRRQGHSQRLPLLLSRMRHTDSHYRRQDRQHRG